MASRARVWAGPAHLEAYGSVCCPVAGGRPPGTPAESPCSGGGSRSACRVAVCRSVSFADVGSSELRFGTARVVPRVDFVIVSAEVPAAIARPGTDILKEFAYAHVDGIRTRRWIPCSASSREARNLETADTRPGKGDASSRRRHRRHRRPGLAVSQPLVHPARDRVVGGEGLPRKAGSRDP